MRWPGINREGGQLSMWQPYTFIGAMRISRSPSAHCHQPDSCRLVCPACGLQRVEHVEQSHHVGSKEQAMDPDSSDCRLGVYRPVRGEFVSHAVAREGMAGRTVAPARVAHGPGFFAGADAGGKGTDRALSESRARLADGVGDWNFWIRFHAGWSECGDPLSARGVAAQS